jgi:DNA invertase Pin-like site-specific DNA recombinase
LALTAVLHTLLRKAEDLTARKDGRFLLSDKRALPGPLFFFRPPPAAQEKRRAAELPRRRAARAATERTVRRPSDMPRRSSACTQPVGSVQRAIGYARVSTDEQARHGISLDAQAERIRAYCTMRGLVLDTMLSEEGVSATKPLATRPRGADAIAALESGAATHIVALKLDRLFRSSIDALDRTRRWDAQGITLHLVDMGGTAFDTHSAMGKMFLTMVAGLAQFERDIISERTASALAFKKAAGRVYAPAPYGFDRAGRGKTASARKSGSKATGTELEPDKAEQAALRRIFALRARNTSLRAIAADLNRRAIPTKRGGARWYASTVASVLANDIHDAPKTKRPAPKDRH